MNRFSLLFIITCFVLTFVSYAHEVRAAEGDLYKVVINDLIAIKVLDHPELLTSATVGEDGTITFPYIGAIYVKDMTLTDIEKKITEKLSAGYLKYPVVSVSMIRSAIQKIITYGEIGRLGEIPYKENMTLEEAMSLAGGPTGNGLYGKVIVRRKQGKSGKYNDIVEAYLNNGIIDNRSKAEAILKPDDILLVERSKTFLIQGEASKLGRFVLEKDMTVLRALLEAGGTSINGLYGSIKVRRNQEGVAGGYKDIGESNINDGAIESKEVEGMKLQPDDIVVIERSKTFLIQGEVAKRGRFVLERDMTVLRALLEAGGVSNEGLYGRIKIRRKQEGVAGGYKDIGESKINEGAIEDKEVEDIQLQPDDIVMVERGKTFLIQGEVAKRGRFVLENDMTVLRALLEAGGASTDGLYGRIKVRRKQEGMAGGYKDIGESKINEGAIESKEVEDIQLQPDDILIVAKNESYIVYGEVIRAGEFVLKNDMTVFKAISAAGGFTKWGSGSRVKILRAINNGTGFETIKVNIKDVIDGDAAADIKLQSGDMIIVSAAIL